MAAFSDICFDNKITTFKKILISLVYFLFIPMLLIFLFVFFGFSVSLVGNTAYQPSPSLYSFILSFIYFYLLSLLLYLNS